MSSENRYGMVVTLMKADKKFKKCLLSNVDLNDYSSVIDGVLKARQYCNKIGLSNVKLKSNVSEILEDILMKLKELKKGNKRFPFTDGDDFVTYVMKTQM